MTITLSDPTVQIVRERLASGLYENEEAVLHEAVRQMNDKDYQSKMETLHGTLAEGVRQYHAGIKADFSIENYVAELEAEQ